MNTQKLALFLGMLCGDGCLPIKHNGEGYRDYAVQFYNTDRKLISLFDSLFLDLFAVKGRVSCISRENKKDLFLFMKYSKEISNKIKAMGFPEGIKKDVLHIPKKIEEGTKKEKISFIRGFLITDGCVRKNKTIIFHSGSKAFLEELSALINGMFGINKPIKAYTQREKYESYQLNLNKSESETLLSEMPPWDNGTPAVLSF
jgi:intein/homing endonuclease